jgi:hypothetical protein
MNTRFITDILYDFKKDYGDDLRYIMLDHVEADIETGRRNNNRTYFDLEVIIMPQMLVRKFIQDIGYLAADKNFTYGGLNDYNSMPVIIRGQDLPENFKADLNGYCTYKHERLCKSFGK